jgi:hypothetical protein
MVDRKSKTTKKKLKLQGPTRVLAWQILNPFALGAYFPTFSPYNFRTFIQLDTPVISPQQSKQLLENS